LNQISDLLWNYRINDSARSPRSCSLN